MFEEGSGGDCCDVLTADEVRVVLSGGGDGEVLVATIYPAKAAEIREWNHATQEAMLTVLHAATEHKPARREVTLWTAAKGARQVRCFAVYLPSGLDLRLYEGGEDGSSIYMLVSHPTAAPSRIGSRSRTGRAAKEIEDQVSAHGLEMPERRGGR